ncbi:MAG TPA: ABC transporter ATP-binding protein [Anaerolineales bacterium]|nr:ABC transporter ATP-binding protein [Anaerolineales bacterium]HMV95856.1 ABC transporter ATP-binding protein [Anaerolineales bacterium]HMX18673.1 ABC transporter ATP-binding protein [Anaerolineales bacterium]HMX75158.1 ABC transporter ATP-binding protein [Anaerolineales bacterium]HMZ43643.1 ABC transporter ATP-binding protein [Anaerolineales bacterium]
MTNSNHMPEDVIRLEGVSVLYRKPGEKIRTFKEYAIRILQRRIQFKEFRALNDINLTIQKGEIFGVVGNNGAGKSTLLKVVSRVLIPTEGRVWIKGVVTPLLELGAGFHPELTGRENIMLNGTILGHPRREIEEHMDEIIEFSELGDFIDSPLRTYSSGMYARLGFAAATTWEPDILLLDEVLSVGDESFRKKCEARMRGFRNGKTTSIMVSHSMESVMNLCQRVAWLDHGTVRAVGPAVDIVAEYRKAQPGAGA